MPAKGKHHHLSHHHHHHQSQQQQQQQQHQHQQQHQQHIVNVHQPGGAGTPQPYNTVVATTRGYVSHTGSDFHVPGQNYGAQAGGQVGGGGGNIGVSGARGPPSLGNIQSIGQTTTVIQSSSGGQQQQSQVQTSGVQQQQQQQQQQPSQGPVPTTTPPVHTPSPQEMGKPVHHQTQPPSLQQSHIPNQARSASQGFFQMGPRPVQTRNAAHRSNQGGGTTHVVGMPGIGGNAGQPSPMYSHHPNINVPGTQTMFVQGQVPNIHTGPHQSSMYPVNSQMPQIAFTPQHRHQTHQSQHFFTSYPAHTILPPNIFPFPGPATQLTAYCFPAHPPNTAMNLTRANANTVSGGATHVGGPLVGAQTNAGTQSTLQQPTQQPQTIPPMAISLPHPAYTGHNGGVMNSMNTTYQKVTMRPHALTDIVNPETGLNISDDLYRDAATINDKSSYRMVEHHTLNSAIIAEFASLVAKAASEDSETNSNSTKSNIQENHQQLSMTETNTSNQNVQNLHKSQSNIRGNVTIDSQCNVISPNPTENIINSAQTSSDTTSYSSVAPVADTCPLIVPETRSSSVTLKDDKTSCEVPPRVDNPTVPTLFTSCVNKDNDTAIQQSNVVIANTEETSKLESQSKDSQITTAVNESSTSIYTTIDHRSNRETFSTTKNSSRSPSRRKWHDKQQPQLQSQSTQQCHQQEQITNSPVALSNITNNPEVDRVGRALEEKQTGENNVNSSATPHNHHVNQKANGEPTGDKNECETGVQADCPQKSTDGKAMQKQKSKNKLKSRDLNRKGAEKEGTDMDAFVNPSLQPTKIEEKVHEHDKELHSQSNVIAINVDQQQQPEKELDIEPQEMDSIEISKAECETSEVKTDIESEQKLVNRSSLQQQTEQILSKSSESVTKEMADKDQTSLIDETIPVENHRETSGDSTLINEDSNKSAQLTDKKTKDVVDHVKITDAIDVETVVAQKNEENTKASIGHRELSETNLSPDETAPVIEKNNENEEPNRNDNMPKSATAPILKYQYNSYQWSPTNPSGKKEYDSEFLMKLQHDPQSRIRPPMLPDLDVILKDCVKQNTGNPDNMRIYKDMRAHEQLIPLFAKFGFNSKLPPPTKKSYQGKSKTVKPNVIHLSFSLREDVKLRETENAWKPTRLKDDGSSEEDIKTQSLYKKVRSVLNKLTPQKFNTLVNQVRALEIDTQGRFQGVIDLVFEKAIDEPSFSVAYALMCKELCSMHVTTEEKLPDNMKGNNMNFRKLILTRCQMEFEKNAVDERERLSKLREIEECTEAEKKKELQMNLEESDRQLRRRSVGNIRFIGELYKQEMLTTKIMHSCINHLLQDIDEENLECLCKLLTTIGKMFESKHDLSSYFNVLSDLTNRKNNKKISSRVRFMIQDVIDLRKNHWIPRRDESNPKTMDQIQKEAESERIETEFNNAPMNTPRKDDRNNDRKRNPRGAGMGMNDGWSAPVGKTRPSHYTVEASKLNIKSEQAITLGNRSLFVWNTPAPAGKPTTPITPNKYALLDTISLDQDKRPSLPLSGSRSSSSSEYRSEYKSWEGRGTRNGSSHQMGSSSSSRDGSLMENSRSQSSTMPSPATTFKPLATIPMTNISSNIPTPKPPKTEEQLLTIFKSIVDKANLMPNTEAFIDSELKTISSNFDNSTFPMFVREAMNKVLERTTQVRYRFSVLFAHMVNNKMIALSLIQNTYAKLIENIDDLVLDIPKCWTYFAEIFSEMVVLGAHPLVELKRTLAVLKSNGIAGKLLGELLNKLAKDHGPKWVTDKWNQSGLEWSDLIDNERENIDAIIKKYNLEFITNGGSATEKSSSGEKLSLDEIHDHLLKLMGDSNFDNITSWIAINVDNRSKEPQFIKTLITTILEVSIEAHNKSWRLNSETFKNLLPLITRYVDTEPQLELQCLYAIQMYIHKLMHPQGVLVNVIDALCEDGIISDDAFLAWQKIPDDPVEAQGHAVAVKALTSFFVSLQETRDESSEEA